MRILLAHNYYKQPGGEDSVFAAESSILRSKGQDVHEYTDTNAQLDMVSMWSAAKNTIWSDSSYNAIRNQIKRFSPDIAHFHNTFLALSPSVYYACSDMKVPVVQSLHNYRLACPSAVFYRNGQNCEDCLGSTFPWSGVIHKCYRNSHTQTFIVASMLAYHSYLQTWQQKVSAYVIASIFASKKLAQTGIPLSKIYVKPNFVEDYFQKVDNVGRYAIMFGRLSPDKGITAVIEAWKNLPEIPLKITGGGEMREFVQKAAAANPSISYLGYVDRADLIELIRNSRFVVFASMLYEVFPMTVIETFACGVPIIAPRGGAVEEIVTNGVTGLLFEPSDSYDLARKSDWLWNHPGEAMRMGKNARREYQEKYTPETNYRQLMNIYEKVLSGS